MVDVSQKNEVISALLGELSAICDRGYALAVHIRYTRPALLYQSYDKAWVDHYSEKGYMMSDPTVHWGLTHAGAINWSDLQGQDPAGIIADAINHGLINGWTYSVGEAGSRSLCSMTRSAPFAPDQAARCRAIIDQIHDETDGFDRFPAKVQDDLRKLN